MIHPGSQVGKLARTDSGPGGAGRSTPDAMMGGDMVPFDDQLRILRSGAAEGIPDADFALRLKESVETGRPLRVKLGLDPTAGHVTLGWTVVLRKLRQFQDLGHTAALIIGDFTGPVGQPPGKAQTRQPLAADTC